MLKLNFHNFKSQHITLPSTPNFPRTTSTFTQTSPTSQHDKLIFLVQEKTFPFPQLLPRTRIFHFLCPLHRASFSAMLLSNISISRCRSPFTFAQPTCLHRIEVHRELRRGSVRCHSWWKVHITVQAGRREARGNWACVKFPLGGNTRILGGESAIHCAANTTLMILLHELDLRVVFVGFVIQVYSETCILKHLSQISRWILIIHRILQRWIYLISFFMFIFDRNITCIFTRKLTQVETF